MKKILRNSLLCLTLTSLLACSSQQIDTLEADFQNPPMIYRPYVWWHWMGPNFSKSGITKDLEAMKEAGVGGVTMFNLTSGVYRSSEPLLNNPWPEQTYRSDAYWDAFDWACQEAERLGMEIGHHNSPGYSTTGGPWIQEEQGMKHLVSSKQTVKGPGRADISLPRPELTQLLGVGSDDQMPTIYKELGIVAIPTDASNKPVDLTKDSKDGKLTWDVPEGEWTVHRIGLCSTMATTHPAPDEIVGRSLEVDKMEADKNVYHWEQFYGPLREHLGKYFGKTFKHILIDSYEAGNQDWSEHARDEFIRLKGYNPIPWLPYVLNKEKVDNEQVQRFIYDYRDVVFRMYNESSWKIAKEKANAEGLQMQIEAYWGLFSIVAGSAIPDVPYGEFWTHTNGMIEANVTTGARAGGHPIIGAEAFSTRPAFAQWAEDPAFLKRSAEGAFASGVNRLTLHQWVHQPFDDKYQPGLTMGWWGTHFSRYQPWMPLGKAFIGYLGRSQFLLQQGEQVIDYLLVADGDIEDYDIDAIANMDFLSQDIQVQDGCVVLPSQRKYVLMEFPDRDAMTPEALDKIEALLEQGATIVAKQPVKSPSMKDYPACDNQVKEKAKAIWQKYSGKNLFNTRAEAVAALKHAPDYTILKGEANLVHRHSDTADYYYIGNLTDKEQKLTVSLRSDKRLPELWNAENGYVGVVENWKFENGRTVVELTLLPYQSRFVVFRRNATKTEIAEGARVKPIYHKDSTLPLAENWLVHFEPKLQQSFDVQMPLQDFSESNDQRVKHFAGTATYTKEFEITNEELLNKAEQVYIDLGEMNDIGAVSVNGVVADTLWYEPYRTDIKPLLRAGKNKITVTVAVNWTNRMIGDEQYPADFELSTATYRPDWGDCGHAIKGFPEWFLKNEPRPQKDRVAFSTWIYHKKGAPLVKAGLAGPVTLEFWK